MNIWIPILITSIAGLSTILGNILLFIDIKYKDKLISFCMGLSFVVMFLISIFDLVPEENRFLESFIGRRKFKKHRKEKILAIVGIYGLLTVMFVLNSVFCVVPGWMDYAIKDYEIYDGEFETISSGRDRFIETEDGVTLFGNHGLETEKTYYGEIVYGKRSKLTLGVRVSNGE